MPHAPKPFYRSARAAFYVQLGRKQVRLAAGPHDAATERLAWAEFHRLMAGQPAGAAPPAGDHPGTTAAAPAAEPTVGVVFERFLAWTQSHRSPRTYQFYRDRIQSFCDHLRVAAAMPAMALRPFHVAEWADSKRTWGANQTRGAIVSVARAFNWAAKMGYAPASPVRGVDRPAATRRESGLTPAGFADLLARVADQPFRDLLEFAWEAGCRPQEARHVEARHVRADLGRVEIPPAEAKGRRRWRVIYLSEPAARIVARLAAAHPDGKLFRNTDGNPWTVHAVNCRFYRLKRKLGRRYAMYDLRHAFATRKLKEGHDPITVAALLGHRDGAMLCKHYEGLSGDGGHLLRAVR